jgi:hypothetical protein
MGTPHGLYVGRVMHRRLKPFRHRLDYRVFYCLLDLDRLEALPRLMPHNRRGLLSFQDRDHGHRDGRPLRPWAEAQLAARGIDLGGGPIRLLCFPRVLGFTFNPLSIYFCHRPDGTLGAIIYEVKNTFGDQHCYVLPVDASAGPVTHAQAKEFHVSPFIGMEGTYRFRIRPPDGKLSVLIRQSDPEGELLVAALTGDRRDLDNGALASAFLTHPLMTLKVVGAIHWEALKLWLKGATFHRRPEPPVRPADGPRIA